MATTSFYNHEGKNIGNLELSDSVFGVQKNNDLIHQVYLAIEANRREPWANTKDKSEVRGGGKKPWKQKGTGRARHGSIRSPIWKGGGVTFGPLSERNYKQKINTKMKRKAVCMVLSEKLNSQTFLVIEAQEITGKTKQMVELRGKLPGNGKSTLIISAGNNDSNLLRATHNVVKLDVQRAQDLNVVDLLHHQYIIATKEAVSILEQRLG